MTEIVLTWKTSRISLIAHSPWLLRDFSIVFKEQLLSTGIFFTRKITSESCMQSKAFFNGGKHRSGLWFVAFLAYGQFSFVLNLPHGDRDAERITTWPAI